MNNEFESGRYGVHLKYFESVADYTEYLDSSLTVKARPNVSYCDGNMKIVKYNWQTNTTVLTENTNKAVFDLLLAAGIPYTGADGYTTSDLGRITLEDIYDSNGGSGGWSATGWGDANKDYWDDPSAWNEQGVSIFYMYSKSDNDIDFYWDFPEFLYFTSINSIPQNMFDNCYGLESIVIPSSVTYIGKLAFHDCHLLQNVTILNSRNNVLIYDELYEDTYVSEHDWYNNLNSAFAYTGITTSGTSEQDDYIDVYNSALERMLGQGFLTFAPN